MDLTKAILFQKHIDVGMTLIEDEDSVTLSVKDGVIARWNYNSPTVEEIRRAANLALMGIIFK